MVFKGSKHLKRGWNSSCFSLKNDKGKGSARSVVATEEDEGETDPEQVTDNIKDIIKINSIYY